MTQTGDSWEEGEKEMGARYRAGREGAAQAPGDRAKDKIDKIRPQALTTEFWGGEEECAGL